MQKIEVCDSFVLAMSLLLFADTDGTLFLFVLAAALHETGHWAALRLCGGQLLRLRLTAAGAVMHYRMGEFALRRCIIALAGPCMSLLAAFVAARANAFAFAGANFLLGVFNLLPIQPLDGGAICFWIFRRNTGIARALSKLAAALLLLFGLCIAHSGGGYSLLLLGGFLLFQQKNLQRF